MKPTILIIDDEPLLSEIIAMYVQELGYRTDEANTAKDAAAKISKGCYAMIISDVSLPGKSGLQILKEAKETGVILPPAILVSGLAGPDLLVQGRPLGVVEVLQKPFADEAIQDSVKRILGTAEFPVSESVLRAETP